MKPPVSAAGVLAAALSLALPAVPYAAQSGARDDASCVHAGSPGYPAIVKTLEEAERADRRNATSWSADNPVVDRFFHRKAEEVALLIRQLREGRAASLARIDRALDTSAAQRFE
jgi:hypothetical protein